MQSSIEEMLRKGLVITVRGLPGAGKTVIMREIIIPALKKAGYKIPIIDDDEHELLVIPPAEQPS